MYMNGNVQNHTIKLKIVKEKKFKMKFDMITALIWRLIK